MKIKLVQIVKIEFIAPQCGSTEEELRQNVYIINFFFSLHFLLHEKWRWKIFLRNIDTSNIKHAYETAPKCCVNVAPFDWLPLSRVCRRELQSSMIIRAIMLFIICRKCTIHMWLRTHAYTHSRMSIRLTREWFLRFTNYFTRAETSDTQQTNKRDWKTKMTIWSMQFCRANAANIFFIFVLDWAFMEWAFVRMAMAQMFCMTRSRLFCRFILFNISFLFHWIFAHFFHWNYFTCLSFDSLVALRCLFNFNRSCLAQSTLSEQTISEIFSFRLFLLILSSSYFEFKWDFIGCVSWDN